jgi:hypothetical protein
MLKFFFTVMIFSKTFSVLSFATGGQPPYQSGLPDVTRYTFDMVILLFGWYYLFIRKPE